LPIFPLQARSDPFPTPQWDEIAGHGRETGRCADLCKKIDCYTQKYSDHEGELVTESMQVLVVDDDPDVRELLDDYLSEQGYEVISADSAATARDILEDQTPSVVLLDFRSHRPSPENKKNPAQGPGLRSVERH
jgi:hypothetical protein